MDYPVEGQSHQASSVKATLRFVLSRSDFAHAHKPSLILKVSFVRAGGSASGHRFSAFSFLGGDANPGRPLSLSHF